jgi:AcrR family transcriptional regulator
MDSAVPSRQRRKEARPAELTAAALELFVEKGYAATRLEDVAARAGVSKGTLYLYFDSKDTLFKAVIQEGIVPALAEGDSLVSTYTGTSADLLRDIINIWWLMMGSTPLGGVPKLMISEARNFPELANFYHDTVIVRGRDLLRRILLRGMAAGEFRPLEIETAIDVIFAPLLMLLIWRYSMGSCGCSEQDPVSYLKTHIDLTLGGLSKPATR